MARSHYCQVTFDADIKGMYNLDLVGSKTIATIAAARIWRNIGRKAAAGYAAKRGLNMSLVRIACQLEAMNKSGFVFGVFNMQKINVFMVDRKDGQKVHRYIIPNNDIFAHKQWIIDNCTLPNEPTPCFIDLELPIVIDSPGWYASKNSIWYIEITNSGTIIGYKIGSLFTDKQKAYRILNQKRNSENSKIQIFDVTGRDTPSIDAAQVIVSKFEF